MNRRKFVSLCSTTGLASLAGCQVFGSTLERGPARFDAVELSGPSDATVGESVSLTVSVTNDGGTAGDFADALTVEGTADSETPVRIEEVPPSESRTVEVGPYAVGYAGDHRFALADAGVSHAVSVSAPTLRAGDTFAVPDGPKVVVSDATAYASLLYDAPDRGDGQDGRSSDERRVLSTDEESVFVVLRVSVANRSQQSVPVGPSSFEVTDGEIATSLGTDDESLEAVSGPDGEPFSEESIPPGESQSGWLLAEVSRASVASGLRVAWNRPSSEPDGRTEETTESESTRSESDATSESQSDATPKNRSDETPEVDWLFDPFESPRFEVSDLTLLGATELGSSITALATVENTGAVASTYRGVLERRNADETDWERLETFEREIAPGASATVASEVRASAVGRTEYRLRPGATVESSTVRRAERAFGERFRTPDGSTIRVDIGTDSFAGLFDLYTYHDGEFNRVRATRGHTFALVKVTVENTAAESLRLPDRAAFSMLAAGEQRSVYHSSSSESVSLRNPVEGSFYAPASRYEPGETHSGWLVFDVPDDVAIADLAVRYSPSEDVTVTWSEG